MAEQVGGGLEQHHEFGLGLLTDPDHRDREYPMSLALDATLPLPTQMFYQTGPILNQGKLPQCVGYSWKQWLVTAPVVTNAAHPTPSEIYCAAQRLDPWQGDCTHPTYDGTTIRAAAKALQNQRHIATYLWAWDAETIRVWILSGKGPVVVGTLWYRSMFYPGKGYVLSVDTTVPPAGGHAYLLSGYTDNGRLFEVTNSWGALWAGAGKAKLAYDDLNKLLSQNGDACTAVEVKV